jgi:arylsulfatase A-like enzyme
LVSALAACFGGYPDGGSILAAQRATGGEKPNFLFVLTDDADRSLLWRMPEIEERMRSKGKTFHNTFAPFPACCPSRSTILRGQYPHNHGVVANSAPTGALAKYNRVGNDKDNLATRLSAAGYRTGLFGKYLNDYRGGYVPPGWDEWHGAVGAYGNQTVYENGRFNEYDYRERHETEVFGEKVERFVRSGQSTPWFAYISFNSPHMPTFVEGKYADKYRDEVSPKSPAFDEKDVSDKPTWVRRLPRVSDEDRKHYNRQHRNRLREMRSVDDEVADLLRTLSETGQLKNTHVVLWNDNGWHMGQHRLPKGKRTAYEEDVRYPLVVRGPGVARDTNAGQLVSGADLMPTFLELAGAEVPDYVDGRSLVPLLSRETEVAWRDALLLEGYAEGFEEREYTPPNFKAVRTADGRTYVEYSTGEKELYDLGSDPNQVRSLHDDPEHRTEKQILSERLDALRDCSGDGCRAAEEAP